MIVFFLYLPGITLPENCWANLLRTTIFHHQIYNFHLQHRILIYIRKNILQVLSGTCRNSICPMPVKYKLQNQRGFHVDTPTNRHTKDGIPMETSIPAVEIVLFQPFSYWLLLLLWVFLHFIQETFPQQQLADTREGPASETEHSHICLQYGQKCIQAWWIPYNNSFQPLINNSWTKRIRNWLCLHLQSWLYRLSCSPPPPCSFTSSSRPQHLVTSSDIKHKLRD